MFSKNISGSERVFRLLLALFLIVFSITGQIGNWGWVMGLYLLVTALLSRCLLYALLSPQAEQD